MPFNEKEKLGIISLLVKEEQNIHILFKLANSVTGNVVDIASAQEAFDFICIHIKDAQTLLNKRTITKEVLFKYLHNNRVAVAPDFTKSTLVNKVLDYWNGAEAINSTVTIGNSSQSNGTSLIAHDGTSSALNNDCTLKVSECTSLTSPSLLNRVEEAHYPIHLLARKFSEWFFENYNKSQLKEIDFWSDARLMLRIAANDRVDDQECFGAAATVNSLMNCKQQFDFYFNPNLTHSGVQGRMDVHGLVLVLVCGTLHTQPDCVGVFECTFGLMRDPFSENNWKMKTTQMMLRSQGAPDVPNLCDSQTLQDAMMLPVPMGELS